MLRFSEDDFANLQRKIREGVQRSQTVKPRHEIKREKTGATRRNKYGAEATQVDGLRFDSKAEAKRYLVLKGAEQRGEIANLRLQVEYELFPAQVVECQKIRPCFYRCDFEYIDSNGLLITEDVKSGPTKTAEYRIKAKAFAFRYGRTIREVMVD